LDPQTQTIVATTLSVFLIAAIGFVTRRVGIIDDPTEANIMKLVVWVLVPCFILSKVPGNPSLQNGSTVAAAMGIGAAIIAASFGISLLTGRLFGMTNEDGVKTFSVATGIQNYGFIPIPLIEGIFPETADQILGVLFVHNLGIELAIWTLGIVLLSGSTSGAWKRLINGPSIAIVVGLFLNFTQPWTLIPPAATPVVEVLQRATTMMGTCAIPIAVMLVGATLCGIVQREQWQLDWRVLIASPILRFAILPAMILLIANGITFSDELSLVLVVQAAMPTGIFPIVLAKHFGGKPSVAIQVALLSSAFSIVLTPLLLSMALKMFAAS
jgi:predicted permease